MAAVARVETVDMPDRTAKWGQMVKTEWPAIPVVTRASSMVAMVEMAAMEATAAMAEPAAGAVMEGMEECPGLADSPACLEPVAVAASQR
ncbi:MAG: hypothetical protein J5I99_08070, partial [Verrucomicrobia bacterium]|nr:hypothetical protein [Verrucomicrobiota bacterium]